MKEYYRGILVQLEGERNYPDLVMVPLGTPLREWRDYQKQYIFHTGEETRFCISRARLMPGLRLSIQHNGIATRSLPPQGFAERVGPVTNRGGRS